MHRFILGIYDLMDRITTNFPDVLVEGCSGGGARFDAGILCYSPQIWCSDDTDPIQRLRIQYGRVPLSDTLSALWERMYPLRQTIRPEGQLRYTQERSRQWPEPSDTSWILEN